MRKKQDADVKRQERHKTQSKINRQRDKDRPREVRKGREQTKERSCNQGLLGWGGGAGACKSWVLGLEGPRTGTFKYLLS